MRGTMTVGDRRFRVAYDPDDAEEAASHRYSDAEIEWMSTAGVAAAAARECPPIPRIRARAEAPARLGLFVDDLGDLRRYLRARAIELRPGRRRDCGAEGAPRCPEDDELDAVLATTDCAGARQITAGRRARSLADALIAAGVARSLRDGVPWWVIALDLDLRVGTARRLYDPVLHAQPTARGRAQRSILLPSGETVMADDPDGIAYTDAEIRALTRSLDEVLGGELSPRRRRRRPRSLGRLLGQLVGRRVHEDDADTHDEGRCILWGAATTPEGRKVRTFTDLDATAVRPTHHYTPAELDDQLREFGINPPKRGRRARLHRSVRARFRDRADARRFETNPRDPALMEPLVGPHRIAAALRRHDAALARRRGEKARRAESDDEPPT